MKTETERLAEIITYIRDTAREHSEPGCYDSDYEAGKIRFAKELVDMLDESEREVIDTIRKAL